MNERNSRLLSNDGHLPSHFPSNSFQKRPHQQRPSLDRMSEVSIEQEDTDAERYDQDVHHTENEIPQWPTMDDQNRLKMHETGYSLMRKSEFFNKRLKKDTSASRLNSDCNQGPKGRIVS